MSVSYYQVFIDFLKTVFSKHVSMPRKKSGDTHRNIYFQRGKGAGILGHF